MKTLSVWRATAGEHIWPVLHADLAADVAIVGGGITGVTLALLLAEEGRSVVLLEAGGLGTGTTGNSTGNLYETLSEGLHPVVDKWGADVARSVARSRREAMDFIEAQVARMDAACGWRSCTLYRHALSPQAQEAIDKEHRASQRAGLAPHLQEGLPGGVPPARGPVLALPGQAQFHPLAYVRALADRAAAAGVRLFQRSPVIEIDRDRRALRTAQATVSAREIVLATHSPGGFHAVQTQMLPHQEYGLAFRGTAVLAPGIYWGLGEPVLSVRGVTTDEGDFLVCVGKPHKTGQHDQAAALAELESQARQHLGVPEAIYRWSAQSFASADGLPYIGRDGSGAFIATGFGTDGLTFGTLAATLLCDQILGRDNRWNGLYRAGRFEALKAAAGTVAESASVARALVRDYVIDSSVPGLDRLAPGSGQLVEIDGDTVAAYRDDAGTLTLLSPVCTHMKCRVRWNAVETSWDCPCHGSRYAPDGRVLEGPALAPLAARGATPAG